MKRTQQFQIVGVGEFDIYPIKQKPIELPRVTEEGTEVKRVMKERGTSSIYVWVDGSGKEYTDDKVFYDVSGNKVQKIKRTEKVVKFEITDRTEIYDLSESESYVLDCNETTRKTFSSKVGDNAIKFALKKSSRGEKFHKAYLYGSQGEIMMTTGLGSVSKGVKEFKKMREQQKDTSVKSVLKNVVEITADKIENEILSQL